MRRFFAPVESFSGSGVSLDADETRHLSDVLRLKLGDEVSVFDGAGREFRASVSDIEKKSSTLSIIDEMTPSSPESPFEITVAATVLNGEKYDLIVQKAVELGVATVIPIHTLRCDVKVKDAQKRLTRWRRIALEATKQSGRAKLMQIAEPMEVETLLVDQGNDLILFSERDGGDFSLIKDAKKMIVLFGPKGGWDDTELELARANKVNIVTVGGRILRAETASIAITAILQHNFGDLN